MRVPPSARRAIASTREKIAELRSSGSPPRIYVDYLIPLPRETNGERRRRPKIGIYQPKMITPGRNSNAIISVSLALRENGEDADIDPWPGGLAQMYPYAEDILRDILTGVVEESSSDGCSSQVISASDCCGFFVQESPVSPELDVAAVLFPGPDQFDRLKEIEAMVGDKRALILFNRQFARAEDFGFFQKGEARGFLERFEWGFAFQEIA